MNYSRITFGLIAVLICSSNAPVASAIDIGTSANYHNQRFEAWGSSLAWMGNELGGSTNTARRDQMVDLLFDQNNGLGLNFLRYNIGAGQNPNGPAITRAGGDMDGWVPDAPTDVSDPNTWQWDWNADSTQRLILDMAIERGVTQVEAFANSAPWWMTVALSSRGNPNTGQTNLDQDNYDMFGHYLLEVAEHFEDNLGIHFHSLAPMNEPGATWWDGGNNQEGMHIPVGTAQSALVREIGQQIVDRGLDTGLVGPEETAIRWTVNSYDNWGATTRSFISQINTHSYPWGGGSDAADAAALVAYNESRPEGPKKIYATEFGTGGNSTPVSGGITLANQITSDLNNLGAQGWTYWQAVEDNNGSNWGLLIAPFDGANNWFNMRRQYYTMQQFTSNIRPGAQILEQSDEDTVAAYDLRTNTTTLVVTNQETSNQTKVFSLLDKTSAYTRTLRTSDTETFESLGAASTTPAGNAVVLTAPGSSITTVVIHHQQNLIQNAGFDLGSSASGSTSISDWEAQGGGFYASNNNATDTTDSGAIFTDNLFNSGKVFQTGIGDAETDLTGVAFEFSLDVKFQNEGSSSYDANTYLGIEFYGADDQTLTHDTAQDYETEIIAALGIDETSGTDSDYRTFRSARFVAPAGTRYIRPVIRYDGVSTGSTDWVYFDNAYLQEAHPMADSKEWSQEGGGDLAIGQNWLGHADAEKNKSLYFGNAIAANSAISINGTEAVQGLTFFSEHEYQLQGSGSLEIGDITSGESSLIDVRYGDHTISVDTELKGFVELQVLADASLTFDSAFDVGGLLLTKLGAGIVDFEAGFEMSNGTMIAYASTDATISFGTDAVLDGSFILRAAPGQELEEGDVFEIIAYDSLSDTFDNLFLPTLTGDLAWQIDYGLNALSVTIVGPSLSGDFNGDGIVDAADYTVWRDNLGSSDESSLMGAGDGLNGVDIADYNLWVSNYGVTSSSQSNSTTVPEPSAAIMFGILMSITLLQPRSITK